MLLINRKTISLGICLVCAVASTTNCPGAATEAELLAQLQDESASFQDKSNACKELAVVGTEAAVPVLATLLDDDKLAHYARYGLEPIRSEKVDEALVAALDNLERKHLIGVIQSIANRNKPEAIAALATKLDVEDRAVAQSAAHAIARLGTPQAEAILSARLSEEFAGAALVCAKQLVRQGRQDEAAAIFVKLTQLENAPEHIQLAAMLQTVQLQGPEGLELLANALASKDENRRNMGLRTARLIDNAQASEVARKVFKNASPSTAPLLLTLLGDLGDNKSLPVVVEAANSKDDSIRTAALAALASLGSAEHTTLLLEAAQDESPLVSAAAMKTLVNLSDEGVDQAVLQRLDDKQLQEVAIEAIGKRRINSAVPKLVKMINGPSQLEVIAALGETVSLDQLDLLGEQLDSQSDEVREAAKKAFHAACYRMPDREATVRKLAGYLDDASEQTVEVVMEELRQIGGPESLAVVATAAKGGDETQREYATRALGEWLDISAAPVLLELAESEGDSKYGIRGIRGYIRLARQFSMPEEDRLSMCRTALKTANRAEDQKLVLAVLERYPSLGSLQIAVDAVSMDSISNEARASAKKIAGKIKDNQDQVKSLLAKIDAKPTT